jgi:uncharacterized protein (DUF1697 family)
VTTQVAFLRAVNLGKRTVNMKRIVGVFERLGFRGSWTYINSGNVAFEASGTRAALERRIQSSLEREFGFEVTTFVRTAAELRRIVQAEPFRLAHGDTYFVTFMKSRPSASIAKQLEALSNNFDTLVVRGRDVHWRMHGRSTDTKIAKRHWAGLVGDLGSTSRNMNMLRKLTDKLAR